MKDTIAEDHGPRRSAGPAGRWKSPMRSGFQESPKISLLFAAQSRAYCTKQLNQNQPSSSTTILTPKLSRSNPFEDVSSLEFDKCSPGLFIVSQTSSEINEFRWSIDDISRIMPAEIESPNSTPDECLDQETEKAAQEAIEKYFSFRHAVVSPPETCVQMLPPTEMCTPPELLMARAAMGCCRSSSTIGKSTGSARRMVSAISSTPCTRSVADRRYIIKIDESTQTKLSLPPVLPPDLEAALKPYLQNKEDNCEQEDCNISNSTLRRKLFFNHIDDEPSPTKLEKGNNSGAASSPLLDYNNRPSRIEWTPDKKSQSDNAYCLSSPDISPIKFKSSYQFNEDMSVDCSTSLIDFGSSEQRFTGTTLSSMSHEIAERQSCYIQFDHPVVAYRSYR